MRRVLEVAGWAALSVASLVGLCIAMALVFGLPAILVMAALGVYGQTWEGVAWLTLTALMVALAICWNRE